MVVLFVKGDSFWLLLVVWLLFEIHAEILSIEDSNSLETALSSNKNFVLLSYAVNCRFSRKFLPVFRDVCDIAGLECGKVYYLNRR
ncbi:unnamed protein product [Gordionus sp. m RMFG-2023]